MMIGRKTSSLLASRVVGKTSTLAVVRSTVNPSVALYSQSVVSNGAAREKLFAIMEEYRDENYRQTLPTRFVKDIVKAADKNGDGYLSRDEFQGLLSNIGAPGKLSEAELDELRAEVLPEHLVNDESVGVPIKDVMNHMLDELKKKKAS